MPQASLDGVWLKVRRANVHLRNLDRSMKRWRTASGGYEIALSDDTASGLREWKVVRADSLPSSLSLLAGDVVHNLRSALDHLIYQLVIAN